MCLILFAYRAHPDYKLIVAANRDEFHGRSAAPAHYWPGESEILAGRDLQAGGSWLGINKKLKFAALTNVRDPERSLKSWPKSRGKIVADYLASSTPAESYLSRLTPCLNEFAEFNLLLGDEDGSLWYFSSRAGHAYRLKPGVYGLSNGELDTPWPKVVTGKMALSQLLNDGPDSAALLSILADRKPADDEHLPDTGVGLERERLLSARFIHDPQYGTRCSTIVTIKHGGAFEFTEVSFDAAGQKTRTVSYSRAQQPVGNAVAG